MPRKLIIDAYNVIYTDDIMRRLACRELVAARERLVELLDEYTRLTGDQATVVFDGKGGVVATEVVTPRRLQLVYTRAGQTADEMIVDTLREAADASRYVVVSSDRADIGGVARGMGCEVLGSKRFLAEVAERRAASGRADAVPEVGGTDYWLRRFDDGSPHTEE